MQNWSLLFFAIVGGGAVSQEFGKSAALAVTAAFVFVWVLIEEVSKTRTELVALRKQMESQISTIDSDMWHIHNLLEARLEDRSVRPPSS